MRFVENRRYSLCRTRLLQRRRVVMRTLDYLNAEREIVDTNRQWKTPFTQQKRRRLIDEIHDRYDQELNKIDTVLDRLNDTSNRIAN